MPPHRAKFCEWSNKHITRLEKSTQFVTALYGVLDTKTGEFSYARAGHEPPLLLHRQGEVHRFPHKPGMALGLWENIILDEYSLFLPQGSLLVMFTDGMTDCRNPTGRAVWIGADQNHHGRIGGRNCADQAVINYLIL